MENKLNFDATVTGDEISKNVSAPIVSDNVKQTCADRIKENYESRCEDISNIFDKMESDNREIYDEGIDEYSTFALGDRTYQVIRIDLSTGGPADWIEVKTHEDFMEIQQVTYHFADWFDHASMSVDKNSSLWEYAERYVLDLK